MKRLIKIAFICCWFFPAGGLAQIDQEFWFVAPDITASHGDRPVYLRLTSVNGVTAHVEITQPANPGFSPVNVTVPASSANVTVDLTPWIVMLENTPANTVLNKGLLIRSDQPITAYYEESSPNNPDIFALKGRNALGTYFMTPFQNVWPNALGNSGFEVVATEDSTYVTITPTKDLIGHTAGIPFTIMLNRGQTYSAQTTGVTAASHAVGTVITSTKPIAVTIKDDSVQISICSDLCGDQLIPVSLLGQEYIATQGFLSDPNTENAFVLATQDATKIFINGSSTPVATLNKGEQYTATISMGAMKIESSKPVYVLQITGFGCEVGAAILPPINCTGSKKVGFTRSSTASFGLFVFVPAGGENYFLIDGAPALPATTFKDVPGTPGSWKYAITTSALAANKGHVIENSQYIFHFGLLNNISASTVYGFFSSFSNLNLGPDAFLCPGDSLELIAGWDNDSVVWSTGLRGPKIVVKDTGTYWARLYKTGCVMTDTIHVGRRNVVDTVRVLNDTTICNGTLHTVNLLPLQTGVIWDDGDTSKVKKLSTAGWHKVKIKDIKSGCYVADSAYLYIRNPLKIKVPLTEDTLCAGRVFGTKAIATGGDSSNYSFVWRRSDNVVVSNKDTVLTALPKTDVLSVIVSDGCSAYPDSAIISVVMRNALEITATASPVHVCRGKQTELALTATGGDSAYRYRWYRGNTLIDVNYALKATITQTGIFTAVVKDGCTDTVAAPVQVYVEEYPGVNVQVQPDPGCVGREVTFTNTATGADSIMHSWQIKDTLYFSYHNYFSLVFNEPGTHKLSLNLISRYNCETDTILAKSINIYPSPTAVLVYSPELTTISKAQVTFIDKSLYSFSNVLYFDDGAQEQDITTTFHTYPDTGIYSPWLVAVGQAGCADTAIAKVIIKDDYSLYIPNAFTPGITGPQENNFFRPAFTGIDKIKILVYDRWGELMYEEAPLHPFLLQGWDGTFKNGHCPEGVYTYMIAVESGFHKHFTYNGIINLLR